MSFWKKLFGGEEPAKSQLKAKSSKRSQESAEKVASNSKKGTEGSGLRTLVIVCDGPGPPPIDWTNSAVQRFGLRKSEPCSVQTMKPGATPQDVAGAFGLFARLQELGKYPDLSIDDVEVGVMPNGKPYAIFTLKQSA